MFTRCVKLRFFGPIGVSHFLDVFECSFDKHWENGSFLIIIKQYFFSKYYFIIYIFQLKVTRSPNRPEATNPEQAWSNLKNLFIESVKEVCESSTGRRWSKQNG